MERLLPRRQVDDTNMLENDRHLQTLLTDCVDRPKPPCHWFLKGDFMQSDVACTHGAD